MVHGLSPPRFRATQLTNQPVRRTGSPECSPTAEWPDCSLDDCFQREKRRTSRWSTTAAPRLRFVAHWFIHILVVITHPSGERHPPPYLVVIKRYAEVR